MTKYFKNFEKIKLKSNGKIPTGQWKETQFHHKTIDINKYNVGIPCGSINGIFVLDIDIKDNGYQEFKKYIEEHGEPNTLTIQTPSGGRHYYFNLQPNNKESNGDMNFLMKQLIYTRSKIGGVGIDIRSNGGYIVAPPSSINTVSYEIINETSINDMSKELGDYLLKLDLMHKLTNMPKDWMRETKETENKEHLIIHSDHFTSNYKYEIDDDTIIKLLGMLGNDYLNNFELWFKFYWICI